MSNVLLARHSRNDLFTRAECEEILANFLGLHCQGRLLNFSVVPELGPVGYLGEYFHLMLNYEADGQTNRTRLFVKSMPFQNADMSNFIEKSGILKKETTLYETLLNELRKLSSTTWCAQCYFTRKDLFVMQNIVDLGYVPLQATDGYIKEDQMKPLLKGLATMHANSLAYEERNQVNIGEKLGHALYEVTVSPDVPWYTAGIQAVLAVVREHPLFQSVHHQIFIREELNRRFDCVYEMVNPSAKYRNVFCHRDPWGGNVFLHREHPQETSAVFVDFQLCRYCPPAIDVLFAVYLNIRPTDRKSIERKYYDFYYECLRQELQKLNLNADEQLSWSEFEKSLEDFELFGALYNCIAATILRVPGDFLTDLKRNNPEEFHRYTNVDRTDAVLKIVRDNQEFRVYIFECIEDMMNVVLKTESGIK